MYVFGMAMSEGKFPHQLDVYGIHTHTTSALLTYRLWIVWNKNRKLTYILPVTAFIVLVASLIAMTHTVTSTSFYLGGKGCLLIKSGKIVWIGWALVLFYNTCEAAFRFQADDINNGSTVTLTLLIIKARLSCGFYALRWGLTLMAIRLVRY
jgi:hypothetical protein